MKQNLLYFRILAAVKQKATEKQKPEIEVLEEVDLPWKLILYDDDIHTFDEVINQLIKATGCSLARAEEMTWQVHNNGSTIVYEGSLEECLRINSVLLEIQLVTDIKG